MNYRTITACRLCGAGNLIRLFSLGPQYVNDFPQIGKHLEGIVCPIELVLCSMCGLVQALHTAPQSLLYSRYYWYRSGVTATMRAALRDVVIQAQQWVALSPGDVVLDIGSNDGTLLRAYDVCGITRVGVEPADNLVEEGSRGIEILIHDFWNEAAYRKRLGDRQAKIVTACGMLYDLDDPQKFVRDISLVMAENGIFIAQLMCLQNMLDSKDVGNLSHEHLEFYSLESLSYLFASNGLSILDVQKNQVNGGSYRLYVGKSSWGWRRTEDAHRRIRTLETAEKGLADPQVYYDFFRSIQANKARTMDFIRGEVAKGKRVWVYGASTKGNVILQYYGLDHSLIEGASERSPEKWGRCTIGTGIPIYSEEDARKANPDYFLVLPYAFLAEFMERESEWRRRGGKFIVLLPEFHVV